MLSPDFYPLSPRPKAVPPPRKLYLTPLIPPATRASGICASIRGLDTTCSKKSRSRMLFGWCSWRKRHWRGHHTQFQTEISKLSPESSALSLVTYRLSPRPPPPPCLFATQRILKHLGRDPILPVFLIPPLLIGFDRLCNRMIWCKSEVDWLNFVLRSTLQKERDALLGSATHGARDNYILRTFLRHTSLDMIPSLRE